MHTAYVGLGSNMDSSYGEPEKNLEHAAARLNELFELCEHPRRSGIFWTEPQNIKNQPWFANQVIEMKLAERISASACLALLQDIEREMGRIGEQKHARFGPRIIDLDLLLFDQEIHSGDILTLPHPRLTQRAFVLVPLAELAPDLKLPGLAMTVREALACQAYQLDGRNIFQA
jgi:2-amino-4-hydroxy-6-hydroxymethyldihydropteridine diphosphokinase